MTSYRTLGIDTSGRPVRLSPVFADWWTEYVARLGFEPTIVQGGWLTNAADASATTHAGDALDLRVWDRTRTEQTAMVRVAREMSAAAWLRDRVHGGMDPHVHLVPGRWANPSPSALRQWDALRAGRDGLASNGADYHPYPLAPTWEADDMPYTEQQLTKIIRAAVREENRAFREGERRRFAKLRDLIKRRSKSIDADLGDVLDALADDEK